MVDRMVEIQEGLLVGLLKARLVEILEALLEQQGGLLVDRMVDLPAEIRVDPLERQEGLRGALLQ